MTALQCLACGDLHDAIELIELTYDESIYADLPAYALVCYDCYVSIADPEGGTWEEYELCL